MVSIVLDLVKKHAVPLLDGVAEEERLEDLGILTVLVVLIPEARELAVRGIRPKLVITSPPYAGITLRSPVWKVR